MRSLAVAVISVAALAALPAAAGAHAERLTYFPEASKGEVPEYRTSGPARVVCKADSESRLRRSFAGRAAPLRKRLDLLERCRYRHIQEAVDAADSGDRILIMPGVYREQPSRRVPDRDPKCAADEYWEPSGDNHTEDGRVPAWLYHLNTTSEIVSMGRPNTLEVQVVGDLTGKGVWTLTENADGRVHIHFDWRVIADRALLRYLTPVLRPVFRWNHNWSVQRAIEGLEPYARSRPVPAKQPA